MKKFITILAVLGLGLLISGCKTQEEALAPFDSELVNQKVTMYFFHSDNCEYCQQMKKFLATIEEPYQDCFEIKDYEVSTSSANSEMMSKIAIAMETNLDGYIPFYIIGEDAYTGYQSSMNSQIIKNLENACTSEEYVDLVAEILK